MNFRIAKCLQMLKKLFTKIGLEENGSIPEGPLLQEEIPGKARIEGPPSPPG